MPAGLTELLVGAIFGYDFAATWMTRSLRWVRFQLPYKGASSNRMGSSVTFHTGKPPLWLLQLVAIIRINTSHLSVDAG